MRVNMIMKLTAALAQWTQLDGANRSLEEALAALIELESLPEYDGELAAAAASKMADVSAAREESSAADAQLKPGRITTALQAVTRSIEDIRRGMRAMSEASQVPIEPPEQSRLLDACSALAGVLGGGVPGGKIAIALLGLC